MRLLKNDPIFAFQSTVSDEGDAPRSCLMKFKLCVSELPIKYKLEYKLVSPNTFPLIDLIIGDIEPYQALPSPI